MPSQRSKGLDSRLSWGAVHQPSSLGWAQHISKRSPTIPEHMTKLQPCGFDLRSLPPFTGVPRGPGLKVPHGVLFGQFWAPASKCPKECFLSGFWHFWAQETPKSTQKALFGALRGRCPKSLKKHSVGHFQARGHSCKWRQGSQVLTALAVSVAGAVSVRTATLRIVGA